MARQTGIFVENNFVRGLVTEATSLSFPENACTETFDCIFKKTGEVVRRKGLEYESSYSLFTLTLARDSYAISTFLWKGAGGDADSSFLCVQVGRYIYFYSVSNSLSANKHATSVDLNSFVVSGTTSPFSYQVEFSEGDGKLFVVGQFIEPFYVTYTASSDTISSGTQITIEIRDFEGDPLDTYDVDERPTATVTTAGTAAAGHLYNLMNQGWADTVYTDAPGQENPVKDWDSSETTLPSNSDRWWQLKNATDQMAMSELDKFPVTTTEAPKGHFIFPAFDIDRQSTTYVTGSDSTGGKETFDTLWGRSDQNTLTQDTTTYRPTAVAFFANRVFYGGVNDGGRNTKIYFSQILTEISHAGHCYQAQDPTSETLYDLLPTDGGVIEIPGMANCIKLVSSKNNLYVFATNGIWVITGSEGIGFTATDFSVSKLSNMNNVANKSFVDLNGVPAWINPDGIWIMQQDDTLGSSSVTSISKDTIQTFFEDIPSESLPYIQGTYNARERLVYWVYRSTTASSIDSSYNYDRCLIFNTETGAFYPWKLNTDSDIKVISVATSKGFGRTEETVNVVVNSDPVTEDDDVTNVTTNALTAVSVSGTTKFLCENASDQITWAEAWDTDYLDWTTAKTTGKNYTSYFITGYKIRGEALRTQQTGYIRIHSRVESNSSLKVQGVWDTYTSDGARWSTSQQAYKTRTGSTYVDRRLRIRGNGLALQIRFASEQGKPFNCIGWSTEDSIARKP